MLDQLIAQQLGTLMLENAKLSTRCAQLIDEINQLKAKYEQQTQVDTRG